MKAAVRAQVVSMSPNSATFDGIGNIIGLVDMATGMRSAEYDYNPFGEAVNTIAIAASPIFLSSSCGRTDGRMMCRSGRCLRHIRIT